MGKAKLLRNVLWISTVAEVYIYIKKKRNGIDH